MTARRDGPSDGVKLRTLRRDGFRCTYCGASGEAVELQVDHIIPVAKGGSHHIGNLTTACMACNQNKGTKTMSPSLPRPGGSSLVGMWALIFNLPNPEHCYVGEIVGSDGEFMLVELWHTFILPLEPDRVFPFPRELICSEKTRLFRRRIDLEGWLKDRHEFLMDKFDAEQGTKKAPMRWGR